MRTLWAVVLGGLAGVGCGGDSITFPELPGLLLSEFCVRGETVAGENVSGAVAASDCDAADARAGGVGYYEAWRVRVSEAQQVTFDVSSDFDSYLTLLRLESYTSTSADLTIIGENDDRSQGDLDALLSAMLQPETDYIIAISGYDYSETGTYSLNID